MTMTSAAVTIKARDAEEYDCPMITLLILPVSGFHKPEPGLILPWVDNYYLVGLASGAAVIRRMVALMEHPQRTR